VGSVAVTLVLGQYLVDASVLPSGFRIATGAHPMLLLVTNTVTGSPAVPVKLNKASCPARGTVIVTGGPSTESEPVTYNVDNVSVMLPVLTPGWTFMLYVPVEASVKSNVALQLPLDCSVLPSGLSTDTVTHPMLELVSARPSDWPAVPLNVRSPS
jgi:hypothetical protein